MNNFPFPQEFDHIIHIRVIAEPQNVIVGCSGLLLWRSETLATIIHRNIGDKRLISTKNKHYLHYTFLKRASVQAVLNPKYRKRLAQQSDRKQLAQHLYYIVE